MAGTFTPLLRLLKQAVTSNPGYWGSVWNASVSSLMDTAIAGEQVIDLTSGNVTLVPAYGVADNTRAAILRVTNAGAFSTVVVPATTKLYTVYDISTGDCLVKTTFDSGVDINFGLAGYLFVDGPNLRVREVTWAKNYPPPEAATSAVVPINNTTAGGVSVNIQKEAGMVTIAFGVISAIWTASDFVIPVFDTIPTTYQPINAVQSSAQIIDLATLRPCTVSIDAAGSGTSVRITRNDGLPWGVNTRTAPSGLTFSYPIPG